MSIHSTAVVAEGARLAAGVSVGPYAVIEEDVEIGADCEIRAHAVVKRYSRLGARNVVYEGAVIGGEPQDTTFDGGATRLEIGDDNLIRENATVNRSTSSEGLTSVGSGCFLMANAHVAHDCRVGDGALLANNVSLAGHVDVGPGASLGGGVGIHQFCRVGRLAMIGGNTGMRQDALPFFTTDGRIGRARSVNVVGLRRAGMGAAELRLLKTAYRILLRSDKPLEEALAELSGMKEALVDELVEFARGSKRGFAHAGTDQE